MNASWDDLLSALPSARRTDHLANARVISGELHSPDAGELVLANARVISGELHSPDAGELVLANARVISGELQSPDAGELVLANSRVISGDLHSPEAGPPPLQSIEAAVIVEPHLEEAGQGLSSVPAAPATMIRAPAVPTTFSITRVEKPIQHIEPLQARPKRPFSTHQEAIAEPVRPKTKARAERLQSRAGLSKEGRVRKAQAEPAIQVTKADQKRAKRLETRTQARHQRQAQQALQEHAAARQERRTAMTSQLAPVPSLELPQALVPSYARQQ